MVSKVKGEYLAVPTVAKRLGVAAVTIRLMCRDGRIPGVIKLNPDDPTSPWLIPSEEVKRIKVKKAGRPKR